MIVNKQHKKISKNTYKVDRENKIKHKYKKYIYIISNENKSKF